MYATNRIKKIQIADIVMLKKTMCTRTYNVKYNAAIVINYDTFMKPGTDNKLYSKSVLLMPLLKYVAYL